jgi:signal transduction histidine kinase
VDDAAGPAPYRGGVQRVVTRPLNRDTWQFDALLALGIAGIQVAFTVIAARHQPERHGVDGPAVALLVAGPAALLLRRRYPVAVLAATFAATLAYVVIGYARGLIFFSLIVAFFTTRLRGHRAETWISIVLGWPAFLWLGRLLGREPAPGLGAIFGLAAWLLVLATTAEVVAIRRAQAAEAERMQREEATRRASEERLQIAQELHDVLAHNISLISVQAGVGLHLLDQQPEQARAALTAIKEASKEALGELRSVLDVLRREGDDAAAPRVPAPALSSDLDALVRKARSAGVEVGVETVGERRPLAPGVDRAAFRIAQEALTNVTRHAGGAHARVRVSFADASLTLEVVDDGGAGNGAATPGTGNGINGMRERAAALGGSLDAGPRPGGGFSVRARLPLHPAEDPPDR